VFYNNHDEFIFRQSYDVFINLMIDGLPHTSSSNNLDLKNPYFRYTGQPPQPPPGVNTISPSESYWANLDLQSTTSGIFYNSIEYHNLTNNGET